jgi:cob(I)alamin adenosyltransferase
VKIYTRTGDTGETGLFGGGRVPKDDRRVEAYGEVDETSSTIGLAIVALEAARPAGTDEAERAASPRLAEIADRLRTIQEDLFAIGAHLATPGATRGDAASRHLPPSPAPRIAEMEQWIDEADTALEPLRNFVLPGGSDAAARLHLARTVCRRAERRVLALARAEPIDESAIAYLNRLSDLLFTWARLANREVGIADVPWTGQR